MQNENTEISDYIDVLVPSPQGQIFGRIWSPPSVVSRRVVDSPIVLFHDSLGCVDLWRNFPALLSVSTGRRVIAYDRLGFGKSAPRSGDIGLDFVAEEAQTYFPALRERLGINRFVAFGHSVGGGMAVHCAARFGDACAALITESAQEFVEDRTVQGIREAKEQFKKDGQMERLKKYHGNKAEWVLGAWTETWLDPAFATWSLEPVLPHVTCPLLALHGVWDEYGSRHHPDRIAKLTGGSARVEIMADSYHVPHREHEQATVDLVADFLASIE
jgi:pimeloyl-ACP methyl ester carboxylesterase